MYSISGVCLTLPWKAGRRGILYYYEKCPYCEDGEAFEDEHGGWKCPECDHVFTEEELRNVTPKWLRDK